MTGVRDDQSPHTAEQFARELLRAAAQDAPPRAALEQVAQNLGIDAFTLSLASSQLMASTVASVEGAGAASASASASALKVSGSAALIKWFAGGFVVASLTLTGAEVARRVVGDPRPTQEHVVSAQSSIGHHVSPTAALRRAPAEGQAGVVVQPSSGAGVTAPAGDLASSHRAGAERGELGGERSGLPALTTDGAANARDSVAPRLPGASGRGAPAEPVAVESTGRLELPAVPATEAAVGGTTFPAPVRAAPGELRQPPATSGNRPDPLAAEVFELDRARRALRQGRAGEALVAVQHYLRAYPRGALRAEALALSVEAHLRAGQLTQARRSLQRLRSEYPSSAYPELFRELDSE